MAATNTEWKKKKRKKKNGGRFRRSIKINESRSFQILQAMPKTDTYANIKELMGESCKARGEDLKF